MKQNKQEQIVEEKFSIGNKDCYSCSEKGSHCGDRDCYIDIAKQLISQTRQEAVEEVFRIMSEELSVSYPDPEKGFNDRIEMDVEDLCDEITKALSSKEEK